MLSFKWYSRPSFIRIPDCLITIFYMYIHNDLGRSLVQMVPKFCSKSANDYFYTLAGPNPGPSPSPWGLDLRGSTGIYVEHCEADENWCEVKRIENSNFTVVIFSQHRRVLGRCLTAHVSKNN